ncbi:MAG: hypothetical protein U0V73_08190 [Acidimicrobiia bacterium]
MSNTAARAAAPRLRHATRRGATAAAPRRSDQAAPARPRPKHLSVVDRALLHRRRRVRAVVMLTGLVSVALLLAGVSLHVKLAESQFRLDHLNARVSAEQLRYERLRLEVAQLSAPDRIVSTAKQQLGMVQPQQTTFLGANLPTTTTTPAGASTSATAADATAATLSQSWPKVKENLAARP